MIYNKTDERRLTAFQGNKLLARGATWEVASAMKTAMAEGAQGRLLCFDDRTGASVDLDLSGSDEEVAARLEPGPPPSVGRPKLGVVAREVTLLPRHWDWLNRQPGSASASLRKLVDAARKAEGGAGSVRQAQAAADRFMSAMLGDQPHYEEAARALYRGDAARFRALVRDWPADPRDHALALARPAFSDNEAET
ncbi:MAG: DUF2239 family protein [Rhodospirillales bacterium]